MQTSPTHITICMHERSLKHQADNSLQPSHYSVKWEENIGLAMAGATGPAPVGLAMARATGPAPVTLSLW